MGKPIARVGDQHTCPMTTGPVPHVGGPIVGPGASTVLAENAPVAVFGDLVTCSGPPDVIMTCSATVFAEGKQVACMSATTAHGGVIIGGAPTVLVGDTPLSRQAVALETEKPICEECEPHETMSGATISGDDG